MFSFTRRWVEDGSPRNKALLAAEGAIRLCYSGPLPVKDRRFPRMRQAVLLRIHLRSNFRLDRSYSRNP